MRDRVDRERIHGVALVDEQVQFSLNSSEARLELAAGRVEHDEFRVRQNACAVAVKEMNIAPVRRNLRTELSNDAEPQTQRPGTIRRAFRNRVAVLEAGRIADVPLFERVAPLIGDTRTFGGSAERRVDSLFTSEKSEAFEFEAPSPIAAVRFSDEALVREARRPTLLRVRYQVTEFGRDRSMSRLIKLGLNRGPIIIRQAIRLS